MNARVIFWSFATRERHLVVQPRECAVEWPSVDCECSVMQNLAQRTGTITGSVLPRVNKFTLGVRIPRRTPPGPLRSKSEVLWQWRDTAPESPAAGLRACFESQLDTWVVWVVYSHRAP